MDEARSDFQESLKEQKVNINHFVPAAAKRMTEKDYAARNGPCKIVSLPNLPTMSARIRYCLQGKTQKEFAQNLGVNYITVSKWCNGRSNLSQRMAKRISEITGFSAAWILYGENNTEKKTIEEKPVEEKPAEIQEVEYEKITHSTDFRLFLNGTYSGEALSHLISGLLPDQKYTVNINVEA